MYPNIVREVFVKRYDTIRFVAQINRVLWLNCWWALRLNLPEQDFLPLYWDP